jgi:crossover junction endodeoxyribonuclease RusA
LGAEAGAQRMTAQILMLPWPVSTNALWRAYRGKNILSMRARQWADTAGKELAVQKVKAIIGPVELHISLCPPHKRVFDLSNRIKLLEDILVRCGVIEADDSRTVRKVTVELGSGFTGARVTITPIAEAA